MPIVRVELNAGRTQEQKAQYVEQITSLTAEILECPLESVDVIFTEVSPNNWAHAGRFFSTPVPPAG
ncbi:4-oxalocrotonate tautomerase [Pseudomonas syringae]|nr:4-oxalocrotonate tautomerase [Pseudomonas syringae]